MNTMPHLQANFRAKTNKKNTIKPNRGLSPARGLARMDERSSFFELMGSILKLIESFLIFHSTGTAAMVQSLGCGARLAAAAVMLLAFLPCRAPAITGTVTQIDLPCATDDELAETVLPIGRLVQRSSDPKDVRIGNGYSLGGISLWNFAALTNPPTSFPHDISMDHHHVRLDGSYSLNAEAGRLTAWYGTNAIWTVLASSSLASNVILSVEAEGTNMAFTVASESDDVNVETSASLVDPVWTEVEFGFERLSPQALKITIPNPPAGEMQYLRVQTEIGDVGMVLSIPLSVPSLTVGGADVTSNLIASWNEAAGYGDHAAAGYLTLTGGVMNGSINMSGNAITNMGHIYAEDGLDLYPGSSYGVLHGEWRVESISIGAGAVISNWSKFLSLSNNAGITELDLVGGTSQPTRILVGGNDSIQFGDDEVFYNERDLWDAPDGTNIWRGIISDTETARMRTKSSALAASGTVSIAAGTTNFFIRPDGGTNTCVFDTNSNMQVWAGTNLVLTIRADGNIGVRNAGSATYNHYVFGSGYYSSTLRASSFIDTGGGTIDPSASSTISSLALSSDLTATQGVTRIILPTATNGLVPGTLWNDGGTVKVMP